MWRGASLAEVASPSTAAGTSASIPLRGASSRSPQVVEEEDGPSMEVDEAGGAGSSAGVGASSSPPESSSSSSSNMLSPISCKSAHSKVDVVHGMVSSNVTSQVST